MDKFEKPKAALGVLDNWSMIWTWTSFLITEYVDKHLSTASGQSAQSKVTITTWFSMISAVPELGRLMRSMPGLVSVMIQLWVSKPEMQHTGCFMVNLLEQLLALPDHTGIDDLVAAVGGSEFKLATLCIECINASLCKPVINFMELRSDHPHSFLLLQKIRNQLCIPIHSNTAHVPYSVMQRSTGLWFLDYVL
jgi:hypothetical protein